jgi:DNA-binding NarL/FixJ family response regulator
VRKPVAGVGDQLGPARTSTSCSDRDGEVLARMAAGASNRGIARRMFLSERAIERHVTSIFDALGIPAAREANRRVLAVRAYLARAEAA